MNKFLKYIFNLFTNDLYENYKLKLKFLEKIKKFSTLSNINSIESITKLTEEYNVFLYDTPEFIKYKYRKIIDDIYDLHKLYLELKEYK